MPRKSAKGSGMIRLRPDGRWEARVTVGRDPLTGKQRTKSFYGSTQAEVRKKLTEAAHDLDEGEFADSGSLTLGKWLDLWYDAYAVSSVKESTLRSYQDHIRLHIKPALGHVRLDKLTPLMIQRFYSDLAKNGRGIVAAAGLFGILEREKYISSLQGLNIKASNTAILKYLRKDMDDATRAECLKAWGAGTPVVSLLAAIKRIIHRKYRG